MLDVDTYLIKQHGGLFDAKTNQQLGTAKEQPTFFQGLLRLFVHKKRPTTLNVYGTDTATPLFSIHRGLTLLRSKVFIRDAEGKVAGYFKTKVMSMSGGFWVYDAEGKHFAEVKGDWKGWNFQFRDKEGKELGTVSKKWAGLAKEMFTSADTYVIALTGDVRDRTNANILLLAAGLAVDIVYKEKD